MFATEWECQSPDDGTWRPCYAPGCERPRRILIDKQVLDQVRQEMSEARAQGYTIEHDDAEGSGHLVAEAIYRLQHMGETPTDEAVKHEVVVAIGLLFNAVATLERAGS